MKPISEQVQPGLKWDGMFGRHECRCFNCYGRVLSEDEVDVTWVHEYGSVHSFGRAKCKVCGAEHVWDNTDHLESQRATG